MLSQVSKHKAIETQHITSVEHDVVLVAGLIEFDELVPATAGGTHYIKALEKLLWLTVYVTGICSHLYHRIQLLCAGQ